MRILALDANGVLIFPTADEVAATLTPAPPPPPAPDPIPVPTPTPVPTPVPRAPVYAWCGGINAGQLVNGESLVTAGRLTAAGITGIVVIGQGQWWDPYYGVVFPMLKSVGLKVLVGKYAGSTPTPTSPAAINRSLADYSALFSAAKKAGATAAAIDCEPYGYDDGMWWQVPAAEATRYGAGIAQVCITQGFDEIVVYCSSDASWPGSYNDILTGKGYYAGSNFKFFLHALIDSGIKVTHTDAVFHHGPQIPGKTWDSGAALARQCCEQFDPRLRSSIMFWPDIDEGAYAAAPGYPAGVTTEATAGARAHASGPITVYQHHLTENVWAARWDKYLREITAGMG